jgi:chromosome segregation ATPase
MSSDRPSRPDPRADPITIPPSPATGTSSLPPVIDPMHSYPPSRRSSFAPSSRRGGGDPGSSGALRRQLAQLQLQLAELQRQMAEQQEERASDADRIAEMLAAIVRLESSNRSAEARLRDSEGRDTEAKVAIRTLEGALAHTRSELEVAMARNTEMARAVEAARREVAAAEDEKQRLAQAGDTTELREQLDAELVKNASLESKLNAERAQNQRALEQLRKEHGTSVARIRQGHTESVDKMKKENEEALEALEAKIVSLAKTVADLENAATKDRTALTQREKEARDAKAEATTAKESVEALRKQKDGVAAELAGAKAAARASETKAETAHRAAEIARGEAANAAARIAELEKQREQSTIDMARMRQDYETAHAIATNLRTQFEGSEEMLAQASSALDRLERGELELAMIRASALASAKELVMQVAAARALIDPSRAADAMRALGRLSRSPPATSEPPPPVPPPPDAPGVSVTVGVAETDEGELDEGDGR